MDEAEIFEGAANSLTMKQTYTHEFQCKYELQQYPFDSQVREGVRNLFKESVRKRGEEGISKSVNKLSQNHCFLRQNWQTANGGRGVDYYSTNWEGGSYYGWPCGCRLMQIMRIDAESKKFCSQECAIKMSVESEAVHLLADQVILI